MKFNYLVFETTQSKYLYDGNSTNLFSISNSFFNSHSKLMKKIEMSDAEFLDLNDDISEIKDAIDCGYFIPIKTSEPDYWFNVGEYTKSVINKEIKHVMVEMTQSCNMRCQYCVYGGHYPKERQHKKGSINEQTLLNAAKLLLNSPSDSTDKIFNFYGGEPFIEFEKITIIVDKIIAIDPTIKFYFTTNGTLLNQRVAEWFIARPQVNIFVSLGGKPSDHDDLRVMKNGNPTYQLIKDNLLFIRELGEEDYIQRIRFIFNVLTSKQLFEIDDLLNNDSIFNNLAHTPDISKIDTTDDDGTISAMETEFKKIYKDYPNPIDEYLHRLERGDKKNVFSQYFDELFLTVHKRAFVKNKPVLSGVCRPFLHKLFVDINGDIHICENYRSGGDFGNVNDTEKLENIEILLDDYKKDRSDNCNNCWANKLCTLCFKDFEKKDLENKTQAVNYARCQLERNQLKGIFIEYCEVLEKNAHILDHLDEYVLAE